MTRVHRLVTSCAACPSRSDCSSGMGRQCVLKGIFRNCANSLYFVWKSVREEVCLSYGQPALGESSGYPAILKKNLRYVPFIKWSVCAIQINQHSHSNFKMYLRKLIVHSDTMTQTCLASRKKSYVCGELLT